MRTDVSVSTLIETHDDGVKIYHLEHTNASMPVPSHLEDLHQIRDKELLLEAYSNDELIEFTKRANDLLRESDVMENPAGVKYLILGSYKNQSTTRETPKDRLEQIKEFFHSQPGTAYAILLEEIDPSNTQWNNWY